MSEKIIKTRIVNKNDTINNWIKATNFIPKKGEVIIYNKSEIIEYFNVDYTEFNNPIELIELTCWHYEDTNDAHNIKFESSDKTILLECDISFITDSSIGDTVKIDFINHKTYYGNTNFGEIKENIEWTEYTSNIDWDTYETYKHEINFIEYPQGIIKYYNYPYITEAKIKVGDGKTNVNDLPFVLDKLENIILEDGTSFGSVLKLNSCFMDYGYNNTTETGYEGQGRDDITTITLGYDNINKSIYSLVTGKSNINTGNDSLITACFNENEGKQALISGFMNVNKLADETDVDSSNNVVMGGAYNENQGTDNTIFGHHNKANGYGQTIIGHYNEEDPNATFIIGGGTSIARANLLKVNNDGSLFINSDIKNMNGDILYPTPAVSRDSLLAVSPVDVVNPPVSATGMATASINRIVVTGKYEDYVGKAYLRFTNNQENIEYFDTVLNIAERTDGRINIEFSSNKINFASGGDAAGWKTKIGNSLQLFNIKALWTDETKMRRIESDEVATQSITTKTISTSELTVNGTKALLIPPAEEEGVNDKIYVCEHNLIGSGTTSKDISACGTASNKYNRIVMVSSFADSLTEENIVGKTLKFHNENNFIEETIINFALRADGRYNIDYTINNMPFDITIKDLREQYSNITIEDFQYHWKNIDDSCGEVVDSKINNYLDNLVETVILEDRTSYFTFPEENQNDIFSISVYACGDEFTTNFNLYWTDGTNETIQVPTDKNIYTYIISKPIKSCDLGSANASGYVTEYTYVKKEKNIKNLQIDNIKTNNLTVNDLILRNKSILPIEKDSVNYNFNEPRIYQHTMSPQEILNAYPEPYYDILAENIGTYGRYNRIIIPSHYFKTTKTHILEQSQIQFFNINKQEYDLEKIVEVTVYPTNKVAISYTTNNVPYNISADDYFNTYSYIIITCPDIYEWGALPEKLFVRDPNDFTYFPEYKWSKTAPSVIYWGCNDNGHGGVIVTEAGYESSYNEHLNIKQDPESGVGFIDLDPITDKIDDSINYVINKQIVNNIGNYTFPDGIEITEMKITLIETPVFNEEYYATPGVIYINFNYNDIDFVRQNIYEALTVITLTEEEIERLNKEGSLYFFGLHDSAQYNWFGFNLEYTYKQKSVEAFTEVKQYTDTSIQQAIIDSWEVGV